MQIELLPCRLPSNFCLAMKCWNPRRLSELGPLLQTLHLHLGLLLRKSRGVKIFIEILLKLAVASFRHGMDTASWMAFLMYTKLQNNISVWCEVAGLQPKCGNVYGV